MEINRIGIIANIEKESSAIYSKQLIDWAGNRGLNVYLEDKTAGMLGLKKGFAIKKLASLVDLLVVFGGDGTMLRTARYVKGYAIPIVGINLGGFGYLTEVNLSEMPDAMDCILKGMFRTERRMMLDVVINRSETSRPVHSVLNDVVVNRGNLSRIIELETSVDGQFLTTYKADGLIISTPTGSTAYSLSAGGPIVFPQQDSIIVNPICPHTLTNRPIILPESSTVGVTLWSKKGGATLTLDGQVSFTLQSGNRVDIRKSKHMTSLVASPHRDYLEILRTKLGWGGLSRTTIPLPSTTAYVVEKR